MGVWPDLSEYFLIYEKKNDNGWDGARGRNILDYGGRDRYMTGRGGAWLYGAENVKQGTQDIVVLPILHKTIVFQGFSGIVFYQIKTVFA